MMSKVLIVDDSALMRRLLSSVLSEAGFQVATARNGVEGLDQLTAWRPDVVTLDINMPEMDGLTALSMMMQARPTPVVMVSSLTEQGAQATFEALALGAVDFIAKPGGTISLSVDDIALTLVAKVKAAARAKVRKGGVNSAAMRAGSAPLNRPTEAPHLPAAERPLMRQTAGSGASRPPGLVVIGVSTGGPRTLEDILPLLPASFPWPILIAQHMPANFTETFARRMDKLCALRVREVADTAPVEIGHIYIGKGGTDMVLVERLGRLVALPRPEAAAHLWHPSVDLLVESAMKMMPAQSIVGVQLTGMGNDGAAAMTRLKAGGGRTIAESEATAVVFGMPQELIERGGASVVLPSGEVARQLCHWIV